MRALKGTAPDDSGRTAEDVTDFPIRLERLCASINTEAQLNPIGRSFAYGQMVRAIRQRHDLGRLWRNRPEMLETKLAPPIIVIGQMRAGTTRVHRLLAADPQHSATRFSDSWHPVPQSPDLRPLWSAAALFLARRLNPWIDTIHPFGAARPDEELGWLASALDHSTYEAQWHIPRYTAFSEARDPAPVYRELARILRTDAAHHGCADLPRVMKVPQFSEDLATLLAEFPGARIVLAERDIASAVKSSVSLVANQMAMQSDKADLASIQQEWTRKVALRGERTEAVLAAFKGPVARVTFDALEDDWISAISTVYEVLGLRLYPASLDAMKIEQARAEKGAHNQHLSELNQIERG